MSLWPLVPSFLIILLTSSTGVIYSLGEKEILQLNKFQWNQKRSITSSLSQKSWRENGATILEMKHRDHFSRLITNWNKRFQKRLISDEIRVHSLQSRIRNKLYGQIQDLSQTQIPLTSGVKLETLNYIVTVELGGRNTTVIVDTGSDLTWVQCQPCKLCYNQPEPIFNPTTSPSYQSVLCHSSSCQSLLFATGNSGVCGTIPPTCHYDISYGDGSYTHGQLGRDRLVLGPTKIDNFVFGCGTDNKGLFGGASGLMGLGRSELSLISQTSDIFGGHFSYCLPSTQEQSSGSLILGGDSSIYKNSTPISYTRLIPNPQLPNFYYLNLTAISIGGVALKSPNFGQGGILIDSGTVISRLPPSIYRAVKAEFLKQFTGFPSAQGFSILDTCFNLYGYQEVNIPTIRLHFEGGAELIVDVTGVFYFVKTDASQVCLAFASLSYQDEIGIIGNFQQKNTRVVYDNKDSTLGFAKETCNIV